MENPLTTILCPSLALPGNPLHGRVPCVPKRRPNVCLTLKLREFAYGNWSPPGKYNNITLVSKIQ